MRYQRVVNGLTQHVITLPRQGVYLIALRCPILPLSVGSNAAPPHAFVFRGTIANAAQRLGWRDLTQTTSGEQIELPAPFVADLLQNAGLGQADQEEATRLAVRCCAAGLLPDLRLIDLHAL